MGESAFDNRSRIVVTFAGLLSPFIMEIPVPKDNDEEEFIDEFLDDLFGDKYPDYEWDFAQSY